MTLIYRFIFVLLETAQAMRLAQEARLGYSSWGRWLRSVGMLASNLFLRANTRADEPVHRPQRPGLYRRAARPPGPNRSGRRATSL